MESKKEMWRRFCAKERLLLTSQDDEAILAKRGEQIRREKDREIREMIELYE